MARKPKIPEHANHERWLVSYADFITLLFAFFTVLYATAQTDAGKVKKFVGAAERAFNSGIFSSGSNDPMFAGDGTATGKDPIDPGMNLKEVEKKITQELQKAGDKTEGVRLERHAEGLTLQLETRHFFNPGSDVLRPEALAILPGVVKILKESLRKLRVEGHTDNTAIHTARFPSNWELSTARALAVLRFLIENGVSPQRLSVAGFAEFQPLKPNTTREGKSRNRRVEIVILNDRPSFWASLKKPKTDAFAPLEWKTLISHDRISPPPTLPLGPPKGPSQEPLFPSPDNGEGAWRPLESPPPPTGVPQGKGAPR